MCFRRHWSRTFTLISILCKNSSICMFYVAFLLFFPVIRHWRHQIILKYFSPVCLVRCLREINYYWTCNELQTFWPWSLPTIFVSWPHLKIIFNIAYWWLKIKGMYIAYGVVTLEGWAKLFEHHTAITNINNELHFIKYIVN